MPVVTRSAARRHKEGMATPHEKCPNASQPDASQPDASQPDASQPDASQPDASQPVASQPVASQPVACSDDALTDRGSIYVHLYDKTTRHQINTEFGAYITEQMSATPINMLIRFDIMWHDYCMHCGRPDLMDTREESASADKFVTIMRCLITHADRVDVALPVENRPLSVKDSILYVCRFLTIPLVEQLYHFRCCVHKFPLRKSLIGVLLSKLFFIVRITHGNKGPYYKQRILAATRFIDLIRDGIPDEAFEAAGLSFLATRNRKRDKAAVRERVLTPSTSNEYRNLWTHILRSDLLAAEIANQNRIRA